MHFSLYFRSTQNLGIVLEKEKNYLGGLISAVLDFIYPPSCCECNAPLGDNSTLLCPACSGSLVLIEPQGNCERCSGPIPSESVECVFCGRIDDVIDRVCSAAYYMGPAPALIKALKYHGARNAASVIAEVMSRSHFAEFLAEKHCLVIPVPLHRWRKRSRGYNQSELIAAEFVKTNEDGQLQFENGVLVRNRRTRTQTKLDSGARKKNVYGAFSINNSSLLKNRAVCLVDDVITTGATIGACARVLKKAGAKEVYAFTFARA